MTRICYEAMPRAGVSYLTPESAFYQVGKRYHFKICQTTDTAKLHVHIEINCE